MQDEVVALVVLLAERVVVVVESDDAHGPLLFAAEASMNTRGRPDAIGMAMFPLESTVTDVQVNISISSIPEEYPLSPRDKVYELLGDP